MTHEANIFYGMEGNTPKQELNYIFLLYVYQFCRIWFFLTMLMSFLFDNKMTSHVISDIILNDIVPKNN